MPKSWPGGRRMASKSTLARSMPRRSAVSCMSFITITSAMVLSSDFRLSTEKDWCSCNFEAKPKQNTTIFHRKIPYCTCCPPSELGCSPPISNPPLHQDVIQVWRRITTALDSVSQCYARGWMLGTVNVGESN